MQVKILLPHQIFLEIKDVISVVVETPEGSFGILPNRLDCVTPVVPGILTYQVSANEYAYIAIDEGMLVKTGKQLLISVRRAVIGSSLEQLHETVEQEFLKLDQQQLELRSVLAKLETTFLKQFSSMSRD
ncbi:MULTISPECIES: F0F1 ATP synthase subunit epsilon [Alteromonadaceae]|uniref:F0F1 ATP synthase subunit epsilon n=1 Tax=Alteromonadaceae TaxID=72275 RepID=UPI001C0A1797|nr:MULTISPECIES: F0F1 ATP synthase subunit epsilon [Aliiglaciecola]MBU2878255.1 F0F1 ATP synthase subunit epsilon [Aliiglaciecola lipolytica]MDO6711834.1 F0F1 ATP synthase subunit epsilon [Aliiglaciecola sp. 2_MG-2023]MDO6752992.1 F0F1 ATP synthase subunit epsilon [Aliiglaciecola sp. 1_MG-2023]